MIGLISDDRQPQTVQLGESVYDMSAGRLFCVSGEEIRLRDKSHRVLRSLVDCLGAPVSRRELFDHVWGEVAVTDDSLTQCISDIRRALNDTEHQVLRTIPKRGYILAGRVLAGHEPALRVANGGGAAQALSPPRIEARLDPRDILPTLAVLPLRSVLQGEENILGALLADEIASALERSEDVNVISRMSTRSSSDVPADIGSLRRTLNADFGVSGVVAMDGDKAVVSLEFAEVDTRYVLWSDRIRVTVAPFSPESDWIEHVVSSIRRAITRNEVRRLKSTPFAELRHYSLLHGAVGLMHRLSPADFHEARRVFEHLSDAAPGSPAPPAWMARWHVLRVLQGWSDDVKADARAAIDAAERALDLDPDNTLALTSIGFVMTNLLHRLDEAREYYDTALEIKPNDAQARGLRGMLLAFMDFGARGQRDTERALHLTPRDPHRFFYLVLAAGANLSAGDCERAVILGKESRRLNRTHVSTLRTLAAAQAGAGDMAGARDTLGELMQLQPNFRIGDWQRSTPSASFKNGKRFATLLRRAGAPE